jgi:hypothetical protein
VQLLAVFALLYLFEGLLFGIPGAVLFRAARREYHARASDGVALLPLRPGRIALLAAPPSVDDGADSALRDAPLRRVGRRRLATASARARSWPDVATLGARIDAARGAVRWLGAVCDGYLAALFGLLPIAIATLDETTALLGALPLLAALHVAALVLAWRAHRALLPDARGDRFETLLAASLFPPHLLRLPQRIVLNAVGAPRTELAAAALLGGDARSALLRRLLAEREHAGGASDDVLAAAAQAGLGEAELRRPPARVDSLSAAYCPVCLAEYRAGFDTCADCRARLVAFSARGVDA